MGTSGHASFGSALGGKIDVSNLGLGRDGNYLRTDAEIFHIKRSKRWRAIAQLGLQALTLSEYLRRGMEGKKRPAVP